MRQASIESTNSPSAPAPSSPAAAAAARGGAGGWGGRAGGARGRGGAGGAGEGRAGCCCRRRWRWGVSVPLTRWVRRGFVGGFVAGFALCAGVGRAWDRGEAGLGGAAEAEQVDGEDAVVGAQRRVRVDEDPEA